MTAKNRKQKIK